MAKRSMSEFRHIVRVIGVDIDGTINVLYALSQIKGISIRLAQIILKKADINPQTRLGFLNETDIQKIESVIKNPEKFEFPSWLLNRPKDPETGKSIHIIGSDLDLQIKTDVENMKNMKSWRGYRHAYGLKVRGQRTKTSGRSGKVVGVKKKDLMKAAGGPPSG